jgi:hypothetical protein
MLNHYRPGLVRVVLKAELLSTFPIMAWRSATADRRCSGARPAPGAT